MPKDPVIFIKGKHYSSIQIYNHVYRKSLQIFWGDLKKFRKDYKGVCEGISEDCMKNCGGIAVGGELRNVIRLNKLDWQTLIHELQHIMFFWYDKTCSSIDTTNIMTQEFFCYGLEFCLNMVIRTEMAKVLKRGKE